MAANIAAAASAAAGGAAPHAAAALKQVLYRHGKRGAPEGLGDALGALFSAVSWSEERWLWCVLAFHVLVAVVAAVSRRRWRMQLFLIGAAAASVYSAERLNALAHTHWASFATQNYFDRSGVFASVFWSAPLILISFGILCVGLYDVARLVFALKRADVIRQRNRQRRAAATASSKATTTAAVAAAAVAGGNAASAQEPEAPSPRSKKSKKRA